MLLCLQVPLHAQTLVGHKSGVSGTNTCNTVPLVIALTTGTGDLLAVFTDVTNTGTTLTLSDNASGGSNTYTASTMTTGTNPITDTSQGIAAQLFQVANAKAQTSLTITCSGAHTLWADVFDITGAATSSPLDIANSQDNSTASTTCHSVSTTTSNANDLITGFCGTGGATAFTVGGTGCTFSAVDSQSVIPGAMTSDCPAVTSTGTFQVADTSGSVKSVSIIAAWKAAPSAGTPWGWYTQFNQPMDNVEIVMFNGLLGGFILGLTVRGYNAKIHAQYILSNGYRCLPRFVRDADDPQGAVITLAQVEESLYAMVAQYPEGQEARQVN